MQLKCSWLSSWNSLKTSKILKNIRHIPAGWDKTFEAKMVTISKIRDNLGSIIIVVGLSFYAGKNIFIDENTVTSKN